MKSRVKAKTINSADMKDQNCKNSEKFWHKNY